MNRILKQLVGATALAVAAMGAQATETNWGSHAPLEIGVGLVQGSFSDIFKFSLGLPNNVSSAAVENSLGGVTNIVDGSVALYEGIYGDATADNLLLSYGFDETSGGVTHTVNSIGPGNFYYVVSGNATGQLGGFYTITSTTVPIPEPGTWAMILTGGMLLGFGLRKRT